MPGFKYNWPLLVNYPVQMKPVHIGAPSVLNPVHFRLVGPNRKGDIYGLIVFKGGCSRIFQNFTVGYTE